MVWEEIWENCKIKLQIKTKPSFSIEKRGVYSLEKERKSNYFCFIYREGEKELREGAPPMRKTIKN